MVLSSVTLALLLLLGGSILFDFPDDDDFEPLRKLMDCSRTSIAFSDVRAEASVMSESALFIISVILSVSGGLKGDSNEKREGNKCDLVKMV